MTDKILPDLSGFTGSEQIFKHRICRGVFYTEGVQYLAENAGAYWLIDEIAFHQFDTAIRNEDFQVWKLRRSSNDKTFAFYAEDGNDNVIYRKTIEFSDFPIELGQTFTLWCVHGELGPTIMLPSEY